jgi:hypothetical protein
MALDAWVHCDCFERGKLLNPPPAGVAPILEPDGSLSSGTTDENLWPAFENWRWSKACEHPQMKLVNHRLGNMGLVALLRNELSRAGGRFPLLLNKVLYNGIHCGDFLEVGVLPTLQDEVETIGSHSVDKSDATQLIQKIWPGFGKWSRWQLPSELRSMYLGYFQKQMIELISAAMTVHKPICF